MKADVIISTSTDLKEVVQNWLDKHQKIDQSKLKISQTRENASITTLFVYEE